MHFLSTEFTNNQRSVQLKPVVQLASHMLSHLLIASTSLHLLFILHLVLNTIARNPGGKKTPQESTHPSPDIRRLRRIGDLLDEAITKMSQSALKDLVRNLNPWKYVWPDICVVRSTGATGLLVPSPASLSHLPVVL